MNSKSISDFRARFSLARERRKLAAGVPQEIYYSNIELEAGQSVRPPAGDPILNDTSPDDPRFDVAPSPL